MNKYQKELLQETLKNEKKVLHDLKRTYRQAEKDIDDKIAALLARTDTENMQSIIYQVNYQQALKKQISGVLDDLNGKEFNTISEYLTKSYEDGFIGTLYDLQGQGVPLIFPIDQEQVTTALVKDTKLSKSLYTSLGEDVGELKKRIQSELSRGISQNYSYEQIAKNIRNQTTIGYNRAARIARTEGHRVQNAATADAQKKAKDAGADVVKQWDSTLDRNTRNEHRQLDGQIREIDEPFEVSGHKVQYPGAFGVAAQDINCRCTMLQRARWALDEEEFTKWDNENGELLEIKAKDYDDFKKKYWNHQENVEKTSNNEGAKKSFTEKLAEIKQKVKERGEIKEADVHEAGKAFLEDTGAQEKIAKYRQLDVEQEANNRRYAEIMREYGVRDENWPEEFQAERRRIRERNDEIWDEREKLRVEVKESIGERIKTVSPRATTSDFKHKVVDYDPSNGVSNSAAASKVKFTRGSISEAVEFYPKGWVENLPQYDIHFTNRGYRGNLGSQMLIGIDKQGTRCGVHELGHAFEKVKPEILKVEREFYERRTAGEAAEWLGKGYKKEEVTRKDAFLHPYMGKDYGGRSYELVSMGFEMAYNSPARLLDDPDYAEFILGILTLID